MDHHCPWINGCVGHFNHRYFFLYMTYTVLGCLFVMLFGFEIIYFELFPETAAATAATTTTATTPADDAAELILGFFSRHGFYLSVVNVMITIFRQRNYLKTMLG
jgi:hypothetical protein